MEEKRPIEKEPDDIIPEIEKLERKIIKIHLGIKQPLTYQPTPIQSDTDDEDEEIVKPL